MVRKTALVTAMLGAFASQAFALGLGDIRLNTVLNQPLNADIELLSPTASELAELRVVLASPEAYTRAGVERAFFHTKLRFEVVKRADGTAVIRVTSREPVREPFLNFLLEATWGSGQVLREYTVLVDPPALMPAPRPVARAPAVAAPAPAPRAAAPAPASSAAPAQPGGRVGDEYRTSRSDTLWKIASELRPDSGVSMEQTMLGLLEANPNAFYDQNINNLKAGYVLRVPSREEMTAVSQSEALSEVARQNRLWREGRTTETKTPAPAAAAATATAPAPVEPEAQLKLVVPESGESAAGGTGTGTGTNADELRKELTLAVEAVEAERLQNQELNTRVQDLEAQIAQLHRLIELKDSEMAQLSGLAAPATEAAAPTAQPGAAPMPGAVPEEPATEIPMPETGMPEPGAAEPGAEAGLEALPEPAPEEAGVVAPAPMPEPPVAETPAAEPPAAAAEDTGLLAALMANSMFKWAAAGAGLLVALLVWMGARRRRSDADGFQESILAERSPVAPAAPAAVAVAATAGAAVAEAAAKETAAATAKSGTQTDSSLFTDFAVSDMGAIQNDAEADPVAEADVYLAYGRYQQAEELIRSALDRAPQRDDLRMKLLEVLSAARNSNGFDAEAEALLARLGGQDDPMWQRVREMGQELNPGNPLYGGTGAAPAAQAHDEFAAETLDFTTAEFAAETPAAEPEDVKARGTDDNSLEFDLGELAAFGTQPEAAAPDLPMEEDLGFDLSGAGDLEDAGEGVLASADEVATKLDLARAYIEMGDPDGARSILDEVIQEGNAAQKSEAQSLLKQIA